ncbi:MAG: hypothetical protein R2701_10725 [Acidimicrobiales bacterium]
MEPRADDESSVERNPTRPIIALDLALALAPLIGWLSTHGAPGSQLSSGSLLAVGIGVGALFLVAEWFPIDVELGEQGHTVAFTAVPLVVGLAFLPPLVVVGVRVGASLIVLGLIGRQGALKLGTNVLFHATQAAVAAAVFVPFVDGVPSSPRTWLIAGAAVLAAEAAGIVLVTTAISLSEGRFGAASGRDPRWLGGPAPRCRARAADRDPPAPSPGRSGSDRDRGRRARRRGPQLRPGDRAVPGARGPRFVHRSARSSGHRRSAPRRAALPAR